MLIAYSLQIPNQLYLRQRKRIEYTPSMIRHTVWHTRVCGVQCTTYEYTERGPLATTTTRLVQHFKYIISGLNGTESHGRNGIFSIAMAMPWCGFQFRLLNWKSNKSEIQTHARQRRNEITTERKKFESKINLPFGIGCECRRGPM